MKDFTTITKEELEEMENERQEQMPKMIIEGRSNNEIINELRFNYGFILLGQFLINGQTGTKLELHVTNIQGKFATKEIHVGFIGVIDDSRQKGEGHRTMNILTTLADKYGYDMNLDIDTKFGMKKSVLKKFYKSHGFVDNKEYGENGMERKFNV